MLGRIGGGNKARKHSAGGIPQSVRSGTFWRAALFSDRCALVSTGEVPLANCVAAAVNARRRFYSVSLPDSLANACGPLGSRPTAPDGSRCFRCPCSTSCSTFSRSRSVWFNTIPPVFLPTLIGSLHKQERSTLLTQELLTLRRKATSQDC